MKGRERVDPAEAAWLSRALNLVDAHPVTPEERDRRVAEALEERGSLAMSEAAYMRLINRAAGTSPELDEAVRLLGLYVERIRGGQRRMPRPGPGGVQL